MPWIGLLLITHLCLLCHSSPVNQDLLDLLNRELPGYNPMEDESGNSNNVDDSEGKDVLISKFNGDIQGLKEIPGVEEIDGTPHIDGSKILSIQQLKAEAEKVSSDVLPGPGQPEPIANIPGLETGADGQLYFNGNRVKSITDLGSDDSEDDDEDDDDNDDDDDDDDDDGASQNIVIQDDDGVIQPDVGWQDEDNSDTSDDDDEEVLPSENRALNILQILNIDGKIKSISPLRSIKELTNIQEIADISEIDQDIAERFIKTQGLINKLHESGISENRIVPAIPDPVSEENSMEDSSRIKIKKEIEFEDKIEKILMMGIEKEKKKLKALKEVKKSHDLIREDKIQQYDSLVQQLENRNMIDSSDEVKNIQKVKSLQNVKTIKPVSVQEVKSLKEVKNIYALTKKQAEMLKDDIITMSRYN